MISLSEKIEERRPFCECPFCKTRYAWILPLIVHIARYHKNRDTRCPVCNENFESWEDLKKHIKLNKDDDHQRVYCLISSSGKERGIATLRRKYYYDFIWFRPPIIIQKSNDI